MREANEPDWVPWLAQTLRVEQERLAARMHLVVQAQLEDHRKALHEAVAFKIESEADDRMEALPSEQEQIITRLADSRDDSEEARTSGETSAEEDRTAAALPKAHIKGIASCVFRAPTDFMEEKMCKSFPHWLHNHEPVNLGADLQESLRTINNRVVQLEETRKAFGRAIAETRDETFQAMSVPRQTPEPRTPFSRFVHSTYFEVLSGLAILACVCIMIAEVEYASLDSGFLLELDGYYAPAADRQPHAWQSFDVFNLAFNVIFSLELLCRLAAYGPISARSPWIWFDTGCLFFGWLASMGSLFTAVHPMIFRVARFARLARLLKALRAVRSMETLYLLVRSLQASTGALFWSFALLMCAQGLMGIMLCQLLRVYIDDDNLDESVRKELFDYFGNFMNALLTMFEITLANWVTSCRLLYTEVSWTYGLFFIVYRGCFMFAVVRVISAVFLAETARCASNDDALAMHKKQRQKEVYCRKLHAIFSELDSSRDGVLTREEFLPLMSDDVLKTWLATLEIDTQDLDYLFDVLDLGDRKIDIQAFTNGMSRIKGPAKSIDMLKLQTAHKVLGKKLDMILSELTRQFGLVQTAHEAHTSSAAALTDAMSHLPQKPPDVMDLDAPPSATSTGRI